ncbi:MAG: thioredoxin, partial [Muribaculaceae bacterium]|nr:thioredoxin [Muribaculaceae bacterium]
LLLHGDLEHSTKAEMWEQAGVDAGVLKTLENYVSAYDAADNGALDEQALAGMNLPAPMAEEIKTLNAEKKAELEELNAAALVTPTPDVAPDKVFDAIVAPHQGKVVVVDLWNTWCGPCRAAIKDNEPAKSGDLASDDIVWIYIANQTSPRAKYLQMISDIKGIHYQLDDAQWRAICDRFKVDGIPYYIIVDRNGKAEGRPDVRDHSLYKKAILEKLAR